MEYLSTPGWRSLAAMAVVTAGIWYGKPDYWFKHMPNGLYELRELKPLSPWPEFNFLRYRMYTDTTDAPEYAWYAPVLATGVAVLLFV
jgi:hypothetical protein